MCPAIAGEVDALKDEAMAMKARIRKLESEMREASGLHQRLQEMEAEVAAVRKGQSASLWSKKPEADRIVCVAREQPTGREHLCIRSCNTDRCQTVCGDAANV